MNKRINSQRFDQLNDHFQENLFQKEEPFENNKIEVQMIQFSSVISFSHCSTFGLQSC